VAPETKQEEGMLAKDMISQRRERIRQREIKIAMKQAKHRIREIFGAEIAF
jgi:hypothetical protein